jgi:hypothetical protein
MPSIAVRPCPSMDDDPANPAAAPVDEKKS